MVRIISVLLGLLFSVQAAAVTKVTATIDRNPVVVNESFLLTVVADDDVASNALDTSALMADFIVGHTSVSSQTRMINFKTTRSTTWTTELVPKKTGKLTIPSLTIEGQNTAPISVVAVEANSREASSQKDIFVKASVSSNEVYVQQQLTLTVKLYFAVELKRASLLEPEFNGATISAFGDDKDSEDIIDGRPYRVIERTYTISPQKSGQFVLKPPTFKGHVMKPTTRRNSFLSYAETKPVTVLADPIDITVKPVPENFQGTWLPSEVLTIHQSWQPESPTFTVGEPVTREVTLTAAGLSEEQLPKIEMTLPEGLKLYPDQAEMHTGLNNNRLVSQKLQKFAIVASRPGTYELPEISIPWWNTRTNRKEVTTLPAQTIVVSPNEEFSQQTTKQQVEPTNTQSPSIQPEVKTVIVQQASWLQWLFLALWLLTGLAWLISARLNKKTKMSKATPQTTVTDHQKQLIAACKNNDANNAVSLLTPWYNSLGGVKISSLNQLMADCRDEVLIAAVNELQQTQYSANPQPWQGNDLLKAVTAFNKQASQNATNSTLSLNP